MLANIFEWFLHAQVMHRPGPGLMGIYKRHTLAHHQFFTDEAPYHDTTRDYRIVFFPPYALIAFLVMASAGGAVVAELWSAQCRLVRGLHRRRHVHELRVLPLVLPRADDRILRHLPFVNTIRRHHIAHHDTAIMMNRNMNLTYPFADWLFGTSDLNRGLLGHLFNGYDTRFIRRDLPKLREAAPTPAAWPRNSAMAITIRRPPAPRKRNVASLVGGYVIAVGCFVLWLLVRQPTHPMAAEPPCDRGGRVVCRGDRRLDPARRPLRWHPAAERRAERSAFSSRDADRKSLSRAGGRDRHLAHPARQPWCRRRSSAAAWASAAPRCARPCSAWPASGWSSSCRGAGIVVSEIDSGPPAPPAGSPPGDRALARALRRASAPRRCSARSSPGSRTAWTTRRGNADDIAFMRLDREFNLLVLDAAGNEFAASAMSLMNGLSRRFWYMHYKQAADLPLAARLHAAIARAIAAGQDARRPPRPMRWSTTSRPSPARLSTEPAETPHFQVDRGR